MPLDLHPFFDAPLMAAQAAADAYDLAWQAKLSAEVASRQDAEKRAAVLQSQLDTLKGTPPSGFPVLLSGTAPKAGGTYVLPNGPLRIDVAVPNVTLIGGSVWPEPNGGGAAITARAGGDNLLIVGVAFDWPDAPLNRQKLPLKPCVRSYAKGTRVVSCTANRVNCFVEAMAPCDGVTLLDCHGLEQVRSSFVYVGGGKGVALRYCSAKDSITENLVRCSPENGVVPRDFSVEYCDLTNLDSKAVIELRSVDNALVYRSKLTSAVGHTTLSVGREYDDRVTTQQPGSTNVRVLENESYNGRFEIDALSVKTRFEDNRQYGLRYGTVDAKPDRDNYDIALVIGGKNGTCRDVRLVNNVAVIGGPTIKPFYTLGAGGNVPDFYELNNRWEVVPPAVTVPGGLG